MKKQKKIDRLSGWEWITLVAAWRYYEHRHTIVSATFPNDVVKRFWGEGNPYSDEVRDMIATQFAKIDHGTCGEGDWTMWLKKSKDGEFDRDDCDAKIWTTFYQFCRGWADGYAELTVSNGKRTETVKAFFTEYTKKWTPVEGYIKHGQYLPYIPDEYMMKQKGETK